MVPQSSRVRLLAVRNRRKHADVEPKLPGTVCGDCRRSGSYDFVGEGVPWGVPDVSEGLQATKRGTIRVPDDSAKQDRGLWRALQAVLSAGGVLLQVGPGSQAVGLAVEQVLGQHAGQLGTAEQRRLHNRSDFGPFGEVGAERGQSGTWPVRCYRSRSERKAHRGQTVEGHA
uniref:(northern house mosquito) hypothetical protein n=1 Tax=Culex pipiens TaxID=7175 RepID=A0A8D8P1Z9_CULPI